MQNKNKNFRKSFTRKLYAPSGNDIRNNIRKAGNNLNSLTQDKDFSNIFSENLSKKSTKFNPMGKTMNFYKILEKKDVIEEILTLDFLEEEEILDVILQFYDKLHYQNYLTQSLVKLIISFERVELFDMLVSYIAEILESEQFWHRDESDSCEDECLQQNKSIIEDGSSLGGIAKSKCEIYDYDDIVSDAFSYSISINKLHITFYLFKIYKSSVFGNSSASISSIINSLRIESSITNKVYFFEERLFIIEKLMKMMDHKLTYEFFDLLQEIIDVEADHNLLVFLTNTVKVICKMIYIISYLVTLHPSLQFKGKKIRETLANIANHVLHKNSDLREVEDLLHDKLYSGTKVIDLIANVKIIEIMNNPLLDSVVSNIYVGSYQRDFFMKRSLPFNILSKEVRFDPDDENNKESSTLVLVKPREKSVRGRVKKIS